VSGVPATRRVAAVVRKVARARKVPLWELGREIRLTERAGAFRLRVPAASPLDLPTPAGGPFAALDAALAVAALQALRRQRPRLRVELSPTVVAAGLVAARLPGRFESVGTRPLVLRDGAHTPRSLRSVAAAAARRAQPHRPVVVFGLKSDKRLDACLRALRGRTGPLVATRVPGGRSRAPEEIVAAARKLGIMAEAVSELPAALARAIGIAGREGAVLVTGSFWLAGAVPRALRSLRQANPRAWTSRSSTTSSSRSASS